MHMHLLSLLLVSQALVSVHVHADAAIDEETLLDQESTPAEELGADDTSLLQTSIRVPMTAASMPSVPSMPSTLSGDSHSDSDSNSGSQSSHVRRVYRAVPQDGVNIPEAPFAWALYQDVPAGPVQLPLANDTQLEPPLHGSFSAEQLRAMGIEVSDPIYHEPDPENFNRSAIADWVFNCLGQDFHMINLTTATLNSVAVPQLVPFIVPMDHPNRTDVSVIVTPGGGGEYLDWEGEGTDVAKWLNLLGISAFVLKYRVPAPLQWPKEAAVLDAQRAVSLVKRLSPQLGLNSSRVGMFGASHGGWVALMAGFSAQRQYKARDSVDEQSPWPDFLLLLYPETDPELVARGRSSYPVGLTTGKLLMSDLRHPMPMFIAEGSNDNCCPPQQLYQLHSAMKLRGDPTVEINVYDSIGHGFTMCYRTGNGGWEPMHHESCVWMLRARRFIMWHVEHKTPEDVRYWYQRTRKFEASLLAINASGVRAP